MGMFDKKEVQNEEIKNEIKINDGSSKFIIDKETAEEEFGRICEGWETFLDFDSYNEDEKVDVKKLKSQIVNAIRLGRLSYNQDETISYTISEKSKEHSGKEIIISRPGGKAYLGIDQFKDQQNIHKTYAVLAMMINKPIAFIGQLDGIDLKPIQALQSLFFAV